MLKIENLSVAVQGRQILHDINLHIKPGEVHVLFGPNGTGKSTLIGTIMGFERYAECSWQPVLQVRYFPRRHLIQVHLKAADQVFAPSAAEAPNVSVHHR